MSRSRKKMPVCYNVCGESQKRGKQFSHRKFRTLERVALATGRYERAPHRQSEVMSYWDLGCEGKQNCMFCSPELQAVVMRK